MSEQSFSERVKKTFGSLLKTPTRTPLPNPLWSLTGSLVEKKEWRRDKDTSSRDSNPCSSSFDEFLSLARRSSRGVFMKYRDGDGDGDGDAGEEGFHWDVKGSIGLDSTLDNEEEEDTFDKVALGRENAGDRLYMSDVKADRGPLNISFDDLPDAVESMERDPRANRLAARIRLKEDDEEAASNAEDRKPKQPLSPSGNNSAMSSQSHDHLKPILKRKDCETTSKASKRVRFDPAFVKKDKGAGEDVKTSVDAINQVNDESVLNEKVSRVPDYVRNPSNYTRYSLDSTDERIDKSEFEEKEENNKSESDLDIAADLKKSVTFVPKKKSDSSKAVDSDLGKVEGSDAKRPSLLLTFDVASEEQETVVGDMEVDEPEKVSESDDGIMFKKEGRQYRAKPQDDEPV